MSYEIGKYVSYMWTYLNINSSKYIFRVLIYYTHSKKSHIVFISRFGISFYHIYSENKFKLKS